MSPSSLNVKSGSSARGKVRHFLMTVLFQRNIFLVISYSKNKTKLCLRRVCSSLSLSWSSDGRSFVKALCLLPVAGLLFLSFALFDRSFRFVLPDFLHPFYFFVPPIDLSLLLISVG